MTEPVIYYYQNDSFDSFMIEREYFLKVKGINPDNLDKMISVALKDLKNRLINYNKLTIFTASDTYMGKQDNVLISAECETDDNWQNNYSYQNVYKCQISDLNLKNVDFKIAYELDSKTFQIKPSRGDNYYEC